MVSEKNHDHEYRSSVCLVLHLACILFICWIDVSWICGDEMSKCIRIDEFGIYTTSDDIWGGCDDWDETIRRTDDEYIIANDNRLEGV